MPVRTHFKMLLIAFGIFLIVLYIAPFFHREPAIFKLFPIELIKALPLLLVYWLYDLIGKNLTIDFTKPLDSNLAWNDTSLFTYPLAAVISFYMCFDGIGRSPYVSLGVLLFVKHGVDFLYQTWVLRVRVSKPWLKVD